MVVIWMYDVIVKFISPGQTAFDLCAGTLATAKSSKLIPRNCHSVTCEIYNVLFKHFLHGDLEVFRRQTIKEESNMVWGVYLQNAKKVLMSENDIVAS